DRRARLDPCLAVVRLLEAGHDLQQRGLARAVGADDADPGADVERPADVVEHQLVTVRLAHVPERVDELSHNQPPGSNGTEKCRRASTGTTTRRTATTADDIPSCRMPGPDPRAASSAPSSMPGWGAPAHP